MKKINEKLILELALKKMKTIYSLFEIFNLFNMDLLNRTIYMENNMPIFDPATSQVMNMQLDSAYTNVKDIYNQYTKKTSEIEKIFERILNDKTKIRSIKTKIEKHMDPSGNLTDHELSLTYNTCDSILSDLDTIEMQLNNVFSNLKNFGSTINSLLIPGMAPNTISPNYVLSLKSTLMGYSTQIKQIKNQLREKEQYLISIQNNLYDYLKAQH